MEIGEFVREQRKQRGLTQKQLADIAGVGLNFVYQLEKNKQSVQLDCTQQVLRALDLELSVRSRGGNAGTRESVPEDRESRPPLPWD